MPQYDCIVDVIPLNSHSGQNYLLFRAIQNGTGFFFSDIDYLKYSDVEVKRETPSAEAMSSGAIKDPVLSIGPSSSSSAALSAERTRKRLHRSAAATVKSYALSDSDDENPTHGIPEVSRRRIGTRIVESNLQLWIKHLSALQKDETKKVGHVMRLPDEAHSLAFRSSMRKNGVSNNLICLVQEFVPSGCA